VKSQNIIFTEMKRSINIFLLFAFCTFLTSLTYAQDNSSKYRIRYDDGLLTLSLKEAMLKRVLTRIADETGILIKFPQSLSGQITISLSSVSPKKALRQVLRDKSYAFIYKDTDISEVYVVPKSSARTRLRNDTRSRQRENRIKASIGRYERRLKTLKNQMAQVDESSHRGKIIMRRITSTEKTIERLQERLE